MSGKQPSFRMSQKLFTFRFRYAATLSILTE